MYQCLRHPLHMRSRPSSAFLSFSRLSFTFFLFCFFFKCPFWRTVFPVSPPPAWPWWGHRLPRTSRCYQVGAPIQTLSSELRKKKSNKKKLTNCILKKKAGTKQYVEKFRISVGKCWSCYCIFFLSVSVNTSHWEICHCHLSTVYHCLIKTNEKKMGASPAATVCRYRGDVTVGVAVSGWDYLRPVSVTLPTLRGYSLCVCVCACVGACVCVCRRDGGWGAEGRCSERVQESHRRFLLIFAAATFFRSHLRYVVYVDGGWGGSFWARLSSNWSDSLTRCRGKRSLRKVN